MLFRDVYSEGGHEIADHTTRLAQLLTEGSRASLSQARRLTDASARFNVGLARNINIPTLPFQYLEPAHVGGARFARSGSEVADGLSLAIVTFDETARPTLVRTRTLTNVAAANVAARGKYWIHEGSGAVVRAEVEYAGRGRMEVALALHETLGVWVPREMTETWFGAQTVNGHAEYDGYQRLTVSTAEIIK